MSMENIISMENVNTLKKHIDTIKKVFQYTNIDNSVLDINFLNQIKRTGFNLINAWVNINKNICIKKTDLDNIKITFNFFSIKSYSYESDANFIKNIETELNNFIKIMNHLEDIIYSFCYDIVKQVIKYDIMKYDNLMKNDNFDEDNNYNWDEDDDVISSISLDPPAPSVKTGNSADDNAQSNKIKLEQEGGKKKNKSKLDISEVVPILKPSFTGGSSLSSVIIPEPPNIKLYLYEDDKTISKILFDKDLFFNNLNISIQVENKPFQLQELREQYFFDEVNNILAQRLAEKNISDSKKRQFYQSIKDNSLKTILKKMLNEFSNNIVLYLNYIKSLGVLDFDNFSNMIKNKFKSDFRDRLQSLFVELDIPDEKQMTKVQELKDLTLTQYFIRKDNISQNSDIFINVFQENVYIDYHIIMKIMEIIMSLQIQQFNDIGIKTDYTYDENLLKSIQYNLLMNSSTVLNVDSLLKFTDSKEGEKTEEIKENNYFIVSHPFIQIYYNSIGELLKIIMNKYTDNEILSLEQNIMMEEVTEDEKKILEAQLLEKVNHKESVEKNNLFKHAQSVSTVIDTIYEQLKKCTTYFKQHIEEIDEEKYDKSSNNIFTQKTKLFDDESSFIIRDPNKQVQVQIDNNNLQNLSNAIKSDIIKNISMNNSYLIEGLLPNDDDIVKTTEKPENLIITQKQITDLKLSSKNGDTILSWKDIKDELLNYSKFRDETTITADDKTVNNNNYEKELIDSFKSAFPDDEKLKQIKFIEENKQYKFENDENKKIYNKILSEKYDSYLKMISNYHLMYNLLIKQISQKLQNPNLEKKTIWNKGKSIKQKKEKKKEKKKILESIFKENYLLNVELMTDNFYSINDEETKQLNNFDLIYKDLEEYFKKQVSKLNDYFSILFDDDKSLESLKSISIEKFDQNFTKNMEEYNNKITYLKAFIDNINNISLYMQITEKSTKVLNETFLNFVRKLKKILEEKKDILIKNDETYILLNKDVQIISPDILPMFGEELKNLNFSMTEDKDTYLSDLSNNMRKIKKEEIDHIHKLLEHLYGNKIPEDKKNFYVQDDSNNYYVKLASHEIILTELSTYLDYTNTIKEYLKDHNFKNAVVKFNDSYDDNSILKKSDTIILDEDVFDNLLIDSSKKFYDDKEYVFLNHFKDEKILNDSVYKKIIQTNPNKDQEMTIKNLHDVLQEMQFHMQNHMFNTKFKNDDDDDDDSKGTIEGGKIKYNINYKNIYLREKNKYLYN